MMGLGGGLTEEGSCGREGRGGVGRGWVKGVGRREEVKGLSGGLGGGGGGGGEKEGDGEDAVGVSARGVCGGKGVGGGRAGGGCSE